MHFHHQKAPGEDRYAEQTRRMVDDWRMRLALADIGRFQAVDPLPPRARQQAEISLARRLAAARKRLACIAEQGRRRLDAKRKGWRVIDGGAA